MLWTGYFYLHWVSEDKNIFLNQYSILFLSAEQVFIYLGEGLLFTLIINVYNQGFSNPLIGLNPSLLLLSTSFSSDGAQKVPTSFWKHLQEHESILEVSFGLLLAGCRNLVQLPIVFRELQFGACWTEGWIGWSNPRPIRYLVITIPCLKSADGGNILGKKIEQFLALCVLLAIIGDTSLTLVISSNMMWTFGDTMCQFFSIFWPSATRS